MKQYKICRKWFPSVIGGLLLFTQCFNLFKVNYSFFLQRTSKNTYVTISLILIAKNVLLVAFRRHHRSLFQTFQLLRPRCFAERFVAVVVAAIVPSAVAVVPTAVVAAIVVAVVVAAFAAVVLNFADSLAVAASEWYLVVDYLTCHQIQNHDYWIDIQYENAKIYSKKTFTKEKSMTRLQTNEATD